MGGGPTSHLATRRSAEIKAETKETTKANKKSRITEKKEGPSGRQQI
jgi:hypothetical protein